MSGVFKAITKVFSAVWDFVRPIVEVVAVAAAVYFTAGMALSAFPATASFAAALPGFASTGGIAGEGVFSDLASSIGMGGGLQAGATADAAAVGADAGTVAAGGLAATPLSAAPAAGTVGVDVPVAAVGDATAGAGAATAAATPLAPAADVAGTVAPATAVTGGAGAGAGGLASASLTNKLLLASVGTSLVSGLTQPTPTDIAQAKATFYGSFYGTGADGSTSTDPNLSVGPQTEPGNTSGMGGFAPMPGINVPVASSGPTTPGFQGTQTAQLAAPATSGATAVPGAAQSNAVQGNVPLSQPQLVKNAASGQPQLIPTPSPTGAATTPGASSSARLQLIPSTG